MKRKLAAVALAAALASLTTVPGARAVRRVSGFAGSSSDGQKLHCIWRDRGGIKNNCSDQYMFVTIPLDFDNPGSKSLTFTMLGDSSTSCQFCAESVDGGQLACSERVFPTNPGTIETKTTGSIPVGGDFSLYADCMLGPLANVTLLKYPQ
jgi:hypothetical protein